MVVALVVTAALWGDELERFLYAVPGRIDLFGQLRWYLVVAVIVAVAVGAFAVSYRALQPRHRAVLLVLLVVADLGVTLVNQELGPVDSSVVATSGSDTAALRTRLRNGGRFAVYDPQQRVRVDDNVLAQALRPDLPMLRALPSVQGYGSVVEATYAARTGTHTIRVVKPSVLAGTEADDLNLRRLLVPPSYVEPPTTAGGSRSVDTALQAALAAPRWRRTGTIGEFAVFTNTRARGRAWLRPMAASAGGTSRQRDGPASRHPGRGDRPGAQQRPRPPRPQCRVRRRLVS